MDFNNENKIRAIGIDTRLNPVDESRKNEDSCARCGNEIDLIPVYDDNGNIVKKMCFECIDWKGSDIDICDRCGKAGFGRKQIMHSLYSGEYVCKNCLKDGE